MSAIDAHSTSPAPSVLRRIARRMLRRGPIDAAMEEAAIIKRSGMFDTEWYLKRYPDVARIGMDPVEHYVRNGASEGRHPGANFDTKFYTKRYPDVVATGMNPFRHYVEFGHKERRAATSAKKNRTDTVRRGNGSSTTASDAAAIAASGIFDRDYYLGAYPAVAKAGMDPVVHYVKYGAKEGRNPCALFDTRYYMRTNPDVVASGMNPVIHFSKFGNPELCNPSAAFNCAWYWATHLAESDAEANPLAHYLAIGKQAGLDIRATDGLSAEDKQSLAKQNERLLQREGQSAREVARIGNAFARLSLWTAAEAAFREAVAMDWDDSRLHERLGHILARQGKWWQVVESLQRAIELAPDDAGWLYRLGDAQEHMNRFDQAADSYRRAVELDAGNANWHYRLGHACEKSDQPQKAEQAYARALKRNKRAEVKRFGVGMLHQLRGYWPEAAKAYARELANKPYNAELHYKLGMAQDRCYRWPEAESAYREAIALNPKVPYWHYRYGFVLERQQRLREAARAYARAAALSSKRMSYWYYRCAYALEQAGEYEHACFAYIQTHEHQTLSGRHCDLDSYNLPPAATEDDEAFLDAIRGSARPVHEKSLDNDHTWQRYNAYLEVLPGEEALVSSAIVCDTTNSRSHYRLGEVREKRGDWEGAATAYADAVARSSPYRPAWYYRLAFVLFCEGRFEEACKAFRETHILRRPFGVDMAKYQRSAEQKMLMEYNEYLEALPLRDKYVLYESMHGTSVGGNPYAIFEEISGNPVYDGWKHVWVLAEGVRAPVHLRGRRDVVFARRHSDLYRRYLATASHLINDVTFPYWFIRRPEQKYLNTWHGTPLKKLGKDIPGEFMAHGNIQRNLLHATHLISPNRHTSDVLMASYDLKGMLSAKLAEVGYPRIDRILGATAEKRSNTRKQLGLTGDKPVVLYAPTWRGGHGRAEFDVERLQQDIAALTRLPCHVVFRGHHMIESMLDVLDLPVAVARQEVDTSDVLAITDTLITDYSSIVFDFLPLHRPIFHYCYDWQEYAEQRGLYFGIDTMPGLVYEDLNSLLAGLSQQLSHPADGEERHAGARERFSPYEDGKASGRASAFFFEGDDSHVVDRYDDIRRSLLFFNGLFPPNGITSSFLNLANSLAVAGKDQLTVAIDPQRITAEPAWVEKLRQTPTVTNVVCRVGRMVQSPEEYWIGERLSARRRLYDPRMWTRLRHGYEREFRRIFGDSRYSGIVNFEGYNGFWTTLLGLGAGSMRNVVYLHNDMAEECHLKHPYLETIFGAYRYYEKLVSVSELMSDVNRKKLGAAFGLTSSAFVPCTNSIDAEGVQSRAMEPLDSDLRSWLEGGRCFLTMGRMSPEKDQGKLIEAFAQVHVEHSDTRLVILGDGPLKHSMEARIAELGLQSSIYLAGLRENPFPALRRCSCFVLPSNHEGQPMVLLEAMILRRFIIATDIDGNRGVLGNKYGRLVHNSVVGLTDGMREFLSDGNRAYEFDAAAYQATALVNFRGIVMEPAATSEKVSPTESCDN